MSARNNQFDALDPRTRIAHPVAGFLTRKRRQRVKHDDWEEHRATGHDFFEKTLANGEILRTHASRSGSKTMSPGRFKAILSDQLRLSEAEFWDVLRTKAPARRLWIDRLLE